MKRAEVGIREWLIGGGIFIMILSTGTFFMSGALQEGSEFINPSDVTNFNSTFNAFDDYNAQVNALDADVTKVSGGTTDTATSGTVNDFIANLFNRGWNTIKLIGANFSFLNNAVNALGDFFFVPSFQVAIITAIITLIITFSIIRLIFNR